MKCQVDYREGVTVTGENHKTEVSSIKAVFSCGTKNSKLRVVCIAM